MPSKLRSLSLVMLLFPAWGCDDASKKDAEAKSTPSYEPGEMKAVELAKLGLTLKAPDNLKVTDGAKEAKLEAEGFPTVTLTRASGEFKATGTGSSVSGGDVEVTHTIPSSEWTCKAQSVGDHEELILTICKSMTPPENPTVKTDACKTVTGFDAEAVNAAWSGKADALAKCFAGVEPKSVSFGFNYEVGDGSSNLTKYTSPMIKDADAKACLGKVYDALKTDPAFAAQEGASGQIECDGSYSLY